MKSKETVLNEQLEYDHFNPDDFTDRAKSSIHKAMDTNSKNVAVELLMWGNCLSKENAERIVTEFLKSEYLKERTEG